MDLKVGEVRLEKSTSVDQLDANTAHKSDFIKRVLENSRIIFNIIHVII